MSRSIMRNSTSTAVPGTGTKRFVDRFGDALVCLRYRDELRRRRRLAIVEPIVYALPRNLWRSQRADAT